VLERRQVKRVGANEYRKVDVRVVAATHVDLEGAVKAGKFREDLFHRLAVLQVTLPPLRERLEDIPLKEAKERIIEVFERDYLKELLDRCGGNISQAAREAGIARLYVRKLLRKHGLHGDDSPD
jgi:DNA-binding NtrC family response regulator